MTIPLATVSARAWKLMPAVPDQLLQPLIVMEEGDVPKGTRIEEPKTQNIRRTYTNTERDPVR